MNVLLPETVIYLIMEAYSIDYHKAEQLMFQGEVQDATEKDQPKDEDPVPGKSLTNFG